MPDLTAERRLVKSPPELWTELSEVERLAEHLGAFGEIKITKLEPEHTVAWEGEHASGTVSIEAAGWGTRVTLTALLPEGETEPEEPEQPTLESVAVGQPAAPAYSRANILARLFFAKAPAPLPSEVPAEPPVVEPEPEEPPPFEEPGDPRPLNVRNLRHPSAPPQAPGGVASRPGGDLGGPAR